MTSTVPLDALKASCTPVDNRRKKYLSLKSSFTLNSSNPLKTFEHKISCFVFNFEASLCLS